MYDIVLGSLHVPKVHTLFFSHVLSLSLSLSLFLSTSLSSSLPLSHSHPRQSEPLPLVQCVLESCDRGHLCVTVPWVVAYLSMMDSHAHKLTSVSSLINTLIDIYRY